MLIKSIATVALAAALAGALLSAAFAARHHAKKPAGACGSPVGRCISDCDALSWCQMYTCAGGISTPVPFWRCFEPSGLCLAPHC